MVEMVRWLSVVLATVALEVAMLVTMITICGAGNNGNSSCHKWW